MINPTIVQGRAYKESILDSDTQKSDAKQALNSISKKNNNKKEFGTHPRYQITEVRLVSYRTHNCGKVSTC